MVIKTTDLTRRRLLALAAYGVAGAGGFGAALARPVQTQRAQTRADTAFSYLAARKRDGRFEAAVLDAAGRDRQVIALPARGHSFAIDPTGKRAVAFARQAGFFAAAFDLGDGETSLHAPPRTPQIIAPALIEPAPNRHFYGHGVYIDDGRVLVATENDFDAERGVLGLYDATPEGRYRRIGEYATGGIGPHEVIAMPGGRTLCVANGGILTHPDYGKLALNLADMAPSLAYIDAHTGAVLEQHSLPPELHRLSIRHLTVDASGHVWFGCQYMGDAGDRPPLVGRHRRGHPLELFTAPDAIQHNLKNYIGSVAADARGRVIATSSPVGGHTAWWDAATGQCLGSTPFFDGCGVAPAPGSGFLLTSGEGAVIAAGPDRVTQTLSEPVNTLAWDNHCRLVGSAYTQIT